jgi:hypothetical protein
MDPPVPSDTSVFHHRGGLQVAGADYRDPAFMAAAAAGRPPNFLGGPQQQMPSDYPYQNQLGQQQQQLGQPGFVFPGQTDNNNPNNFLPNPYSPYVQQFQQQYSSQFAPQYGLQPRLPPPVAVAGQPPPQQPPAVVPEPTNIDPVAGSASSTTEKLPLTTTKTTRSTAASTTASLSEVIRRHISVLAFVDTLLGLHR